MPQSKTNIVLTGMPAVGKSTIGVLLAKRLGLAFVDTDITLQTSEGKTLQELIQTYGLEQFCDLEASHILSLDYQASVIATGGSVVYRKAAMRHLGRSGVVVYLDIDLANLEKRLRDIDARGWCMHRGRAWQTSMPRGDRFTAAQRISRCRHPTCHRIN